MKGRQVILTNRKSTLEEILQTYTAYMKKILGEAGYLRK